MAAPETKTCPTCANSVSADARFCGACGSPVGGSDLAGQIIGERYKILAKLGEGGMGAVYRAEQLSLKREVALKVLKPELSKSPGLVRRFYAEAELAAKLNHPNTVTLFDFGEHSDGSLFIAMELVPGRSLRQVIGTQGAMPAETALYIAEQVCASLADAHTHGIVHRDLKPDNVMLTTRGRQDNIVRVLDFGIAKLRDDGAITKNPMTQAGDLLGTPQYMAPEQIRGEKVDGRADVYAMGCMLYEMITGKLPFIGPTVMAVLGKHLSESPVPPSKARPDLNVSDELERIVLECLHKEPSARPPSMEALGDRLTDLRRRLGVPTPHATPTRTPESSAAAQSDLAFLATGFAPPTPTGPTPSPLPQVTPTGAQPAPAGGPFASAPPAPPVSDMVEVGASTMARPGERRWLWLTLTLLLLAGGGTTAFLLLRNRASEPTPEDFDFVPDKAVPSDFRTDPERKIFAPSNGEPSKETTREDVVPSDFQTKPERKILP